MENSFVEYVLGLNSFESKINNKKLIKYENLLILLKSQPTDIQYYIMKHTKKLNQLRVCKQYSNSEAFRLYTNNYLTTRSINFKDENETFLSIKWEKLVENNHNYSLILDKYVDSEIDIPTKRYLKNQKILLLFFKYFSYSLGFVSCLFTLYVWYKSYYIITDYTNYFTVTYLPILVNYFINICPLFIIRGFNILDTWKNWLLIPYFIIKYTRLNNYNIIRITNECIQTITWFPLKCVNFSINLPFKIALKIANTNKYIINWFIKQSDGVKVSLLLWRTQHIKENAKKKFIKEF